MPDIENTVYNIADCTCNITAKYEDEKVNTSSSSLAFVSSIFLKDVRLALTIAFDNDIPVEN